MESASYRQQERRQAVWRRRLFRLLLAGGAVVVAGSGVAWATIPGSDGVISGCYAKTTGALRVIDPSKGQRCNSRLEASIRWNQTGPTGPAGPTGPSIGYGFQGVGGIGLPADTYTTAVAGDVPAGNYAVTATLTIDSAVTQADVYCDLYADATAIYDSILTVDADHNASETLLGTASLSSLGTLSVACAPTAANVYSQVSALQAVKVAALGP